MFRCLVCLAVTLTTQASLLAQAGDRPGQEQPALPKTLKIPPAPVLTPEKALRSMRLQPGFKIELVAAEPLVEDPVCITFDEDGRIWAVEMRGFMPNVDGRGEQIPNGRVVTLTDTDGDGRMDKSQVFLDGLVLPRVVAIVNEGVLVLAPPHLYLCRDTDGDGRCDEKVSLRDGMTGQTTPEYAPNGCMIGLDNWLSFVTWDERLRHVDGKWLFQKTAYRGQWGVTQDDFGRHFYNNNSDHLRGDLFPAHYAVRNRNAGRIRGVNEQIARDQSTWPIRVTPGINRGYMKHMLRDFKLARFTSACSPVIYRDRLFPRDCWGDAFVCEPAGHFVRRSKMKRDGNRVTATNAYEKAEFLASTDERFRPVDLKVGPDGGLYVVDMYRGILQHKLFVTTFLRKQILSRGLDRPLGLGRIYRVVPTDSKRRPAPKLSKASPAQLVAALSHDSGFWRDTAQRLLIQRGRPVTRDIERVARTATDSVARLHALWTLEGLGALTQDLLKHALADKHAEVRCAAIRLSEPWLHKSAELHRRVAGMVSDASPRVVVQATLSMGTTTDLPFMLRVATGELTATLTGALLSGLRGRELELLTALMAHESFQVARKDRQRLIGALARCVLKEARRERMARLLTLACSEAKPGWQARQILSALAKELDAEAKKMKRVRVFDLGTEPRPLVKLAKTEELARKIIHHLAWQGRPVDRANQLTAIQQRLIARGRALYSVSCVTCHRPHGKGQFGLAPSLVGSSLVLGPPKRLVLITRFGMIGPVVQNNSKFEGIMPPLPGLKDDEVAAILSYIRNAWGHQATTVDAETVKKTRLEYAGRGNKPFKAEELEKIR